jgi:hypothetical protein
MGVSCASGGGSGGGRLSTSIYPGRPAFINPPGISQSPRSPLVRAGTVRSNDGDGPSVRINLFVLALARRDRYFSDYPPRSVPEHAQHFAIGSNLRPRRSAKCLAYQHARMFPWRYIGRADPNNPALIIRRRHSDPNIPAVAYHRLHFGIVLELYCGSGLFEAVEILGKQVIILVAFGTSL